MIKFKKGWGNHSKTYLWLRLENAKKEGKGAVSLDGRLIDIASIRQAEVLVQKAKLILKIALDNSIWPLEEIGRNSVKPWIIPISNNLSSSICLFWIFQYWKNCNSKT